MLLHSMRAAPGSLALSAHDFSVDEVCVWVVEQVRMMAKRCAGGVNKVARSFSLELRLQGCQRSRTHIFQGVANVLAGHLCPTHSSDSRCTCDSGTRLEHAAWPCRKSMTPGLEGLGVKLFTQQWVGFIGATSDSTRLRTLSCWLSGEHLGLLSRLAPLTITAVCM